MNDTIFVGLDVHKVAIAVAEGKRGGEVRQLGAILHRADALAKLVEKLAKGGRRLSFCYEAGVFGPASCRGHREESAPGRSQDDGACPKTLTANMRADCGKTPLRGRAAARTRPQAQPPDHQFPFLFQSDKIWRVREAAPPDWGSGAKAPEDRPRPSVSAAG